MPGFLGLQRFFGGTVSSAAGYSAGGAIQRVLHPQLQSLANEGWQLHPDYPLDAGVLANGVAQGQAPYEWAKDEATRTGINGERFDHLIAIANTGPGIPPAFDLWRRGIINEAGFRRAARRGGLEQEWIDDLVQTFHVPLDPADLARGIHRGLVPDPGLLKGVANPGPGAVEAYPQYAIDALAEALIAGLDKDHLGVLVGLQGNPMGAHEAAQALFRRVIEENDYLRAIAEGNTRNEWAQAILDQSRQIPTARDFLENALRGYRTLPEAIDGASLHGMSDEHATMIYQNQGRPMNVHQITQALARGGKFQPEPGELTDPYMASIVEGNLKPAYYDLAKAMRYTMPSTFAIRALAQSKVWDETRTRERLLWAGWNPDDAADVAKAWAQGGSTAQKEATATDLLTLYDGRKITHAAALAALEALGYPPDEAARKVDLLDSRRVQGARNTAINGIHTAYKKQEIDDVNVTAALEDLDVAAWAIPQILAAWRIERNSSVASLTRDEIKGAYQTNKLTLQDARAALLVKGMTVDEANAFLGVV